MRKKLFCAFLFFVLFLCLSLAASGQGNLNVQIHSSKSIPLSTGQGYMVDVYFSVLDTDGSPVKDLNIDNVKLYQDSAAQTLKSVTTAVNDSASIILLMDTGNSMAGQSINDARAASSRFLERFGKNTRSAVMSFNENQTILQNFTSDHYASSEAAQMAAAESGKGTCLYDSIYAALEMTVSENSDRRFVVVLTDGKDALLNGNGCSSRKLSDVLDYSASNRIPIYTIGLGSETDEAELKQISDSAGGTFVKAAAGADMDAAFSAIYEQFANDYKMTYETSAGSGSHTILIEIGKDRQHGLRSGNITLPDPSEVKPTATAPVSSAAGDAGTPSEVPTAVSDNVSVSENKTMYIIYGLIGLAVIVAVVLLIIVFRKPKGTVKEAEKPYVPEKTYTSHQLDPIVMQDRVSDSQDGKPVFATLTVLECNDKSLVGTSYSVTSLPLTIGRSPDNDIVFSSLDKAVSRHHATLDIEDGKITIYDPDSSYGTYVNDVFVSGKPFVLDNDVIIRLGNRVRIRFKRSMVSLEGGDESPTYDGFILPDFNQSSMRR
ncbi:MAG: VWA domain-containing protein [Anaerolineaceae bacterium]|nr:VWA domain-containing protein [Anaerolineaceae bacterium]